MYLLSHKMEFPDVSLASHEGLLAYGGDLSAERLILAYSKGIFPWFEESEPILWWSPNPRFVLFPEELKVSKSLRKIINNQVFSITSNKCFEEVISECAAIHRKGQKGTWITQEMIKAYCQLHKLGYAKSVEVWKGKELVGGFYGVDFK